MSVVNHDCALGHRTRTVKTHNTNLERLQNVNRLTSASIRRTHFNLYNKHVERKLKGEQRLTNHSGHVGRQAATQGRLPTSDHHR